MAFIPVGDTAQVELRYFAAGQNVENVLYFYNEDGVGLAGLLTITDVVGEWWDLHVQPLQSSEVTLNEVYGTDLSTATSPTYSNLEKSGMIGGVTSGGMLPTNSTIAVSFRTAGRGRSSRGRNYFVGLSESQVTGNTVGSTTVAAIEAAYNALQPMLPAPWFWCVVSRRVNNAPRIEGLVQFVTGALCVDPFVDSQRRRLTGRGL